jgi:hypothetical protein
MHTPSSRCHYGATSPAVGPTTAPFFLFSSRGGFGFGARSFGKGKWRKIFNDNAQAFGARTPPDLKDKVRAAAVTREGVVQAEVTARWGACCGRVLLDPPPWCKEDGYARPGAQIVGRGGFSGAI